MDWYVFDRPGWYLGEGWSLTPESAGVALADRRGPSLTATQGWIRRRPDAVTLMLGGRNLNPGGAAASLTVRIDDRVVDQSSVPPGFFLRFMTLPHEALGGTGDYARLELTASGEVAVEQFDVQSPDRIVFGFGEGWHEPEYDPIKGRLWRWMSERGVLRVRGTGRPYRLTVSGLTETFNRPSHVVVRAGDRQLAEVTADARFTFDVLIPADVLSDGEQRVTIETDQVYVPAEKSTRTNDRRRLGLKIVECRLERADAPSGLPGQTQQRTPEGAVETSQPTALQSERGAH
jgi:hypothetical protein